MRHMSMGSKSKRTGAENIRRLDFITTVSCTATRSGCVEKQRV